MKIGLTGSEGFLGSHLVQNLKNSYEIKFLNRKKHNLLKINSLKDFVYDQDIIIHLAGVNRSKNENLININVLGTFNIVEAIRKYSDSKIIFSSSLQVYGFKRKKILLNENDPLDPTNVYGLSKKLAEEIIFRYGNYYGLNYTIFRISNIYGPRCKPNYNSVVATFIELINNNKEFVINGTGNQVRDFIFVEDVVDAFSRLLKLPMNNNNVYNISSGKATSINNLIDLLQDLIQQKINIRYINENIANDYLVGNHNKAFNDLNFKARTNLKEGLIKCLEEYNEPNNRFRS